MLVVQTPNRFSRRTGQRPIFIPVTCRPRNDDVTVVYFYARPLFVRFITPFKTRQRVNPVPRAVVANRNSELEQLSRLMGNLTRFLCTSTAVSSSKNSDFRVI